jgi:DNA-binding MarR family transcriptional regulator
LCENLYLAMKDHVSLVPLIEKWEEFSQLKMGASIDDFAIWLLSEKEARIKLAQNQNPDKRGKNTETAILITRLQRYLGMSIVPGLKKLGFAKEHEYNFLYQISRMDRPNKKDLSKENMTEFSTGRDVIRRLLNRRLIVEKADPRDGRARLLSLTVKGKKLLMKSFDVLAISFDDFLGDLSSSEQDELIRLIIKLNRYHAVKNGKAILPYL